MSNVIRLFDSKRDAQKVEEKTALAQVIREAREAEFPGYTMQNGLFVNRTNPFEQAGQIVRGSETSLDALARASMNWDVVTEPLQTMSGRSVMSHKANFRDDTMGLLGVTGKNYKVILNRDAFKFTEFLQKEGWTYETVGEANGGAVTWICMKAPGNTQIDGEPFNHYVLIANSFNGKGSLKVVFTTVRVICNNMFALAMKQSSLSISIPHKGDVRGRMEEAQTVIRGSVSYYSELEDEFKRMKEVKVSDDRAKEIIDRLYPIDYVNDSARTITTNEEKKAEFWARLNAPDIRDFRNTAAGLVNAASDMATHTELHRRTANYAENLLVTMTTKKNLVTDVYNMVMAA